jgi:glycosyltransferase involved in cell wall biosynthesis
MQNKDQNPLRIAVFGHRSIPMQKGSAGADKYAQELWTRVSKCGHKVTCYNRVYNNEKLNLSQYKGINLVYIKTINRAGFDSLVHSFRSVIHILKNNTADIVYIINGGNSIWGIILKIFGKKVIVGVDGIDWKRAKWPWYGKIYLYLSMYLTAKIPDIVCIDNIYTKKMFEKKFNKKFYFINTGSEITNIPNNLDILNSLNLKSKEYFLFVGRFIPDKGLHYLISAFEKTKTEKKLVLVGGSPHNSTYDKKLKSTNDQRIIFPGYIYDNNANSLMKYAYAYIQPSDVEGLSPIILTIMGLGTPLICSDIEENLYAVKDTALIFKKGVVHSLKEKIEFANNNPDLIKSLAMRAKRRAKKKFNWEKVTNQVLKIIHSI